jgi:hypothetical protein
MALASREISCYLAIQLRKRESDIWWCAKFYWACPGVHQCCAKNSTVNKTKTNQRIQQKQNKTKTKLIHTKSKKIKKNQKILKNNLSTIYYNPHSQNNGRECGLRLWWLVVNDNAL